MFGGACSGSNLTNVGVVGVGVGVAAHHDCYSDCCNGSNLTSVGVGVGVVGVDVGVDVGVAAHHDCFSDWSRWC